MSRVQNFLKRFCNTIVKGTQTIPLDWRIAAQHNYIFVIITLKSAVYRVEKINIGPENRKSMVPTRRCNNIIYVYGMCDEGNTGRRRKM